MSGPEVMPFCVECGLQLGDWKFCPKCGTKRLDNAAMAEAPRIEPTLESMMRREVRSLIDSDDLPAAELTVRKALKESRTLDVLLVAADVFSRRHLVNEATDILDEAFKLAPQNYLVHVRYAEHFGRVGLYPQALEAVVHARRLLPTSDVTALLYCQEFERVMRERNRGGFVRASSAPRFSSRLSGLRRGKPAASPEAGQVDRR